MDPVALSSDGVAKKGNSILGFIPRSRVLLGESNAPFGQTSVDEFDSVPECHVVRGTLAKPRASQFHEGVCLAAMS